MDEQKITGERIMQRRKELGLSLEELANRLGVAPSTIQRYEKNQTSRIKPSMLSAIAHELLVDTDYLLGNSDSPQDYNLHDLVSSIPKSIMDFYKGDVKSAYNAYLAMKHNYENSEVYPLSGKEERLIVQYRKRPEIAPAVHKLLDIDDNNDRLPSFNEVSQRMKKKSVLRVASPMRELSKE